MIRPTLFAGSLLLGIGACGGETGVSPNLYGPHEAVDFERPVQFVFSDNFKAWTVLKKTSDLWEQARLEAPLLYNDHANMALPPLIVNVRIADTEDTDSERVTMNCTTAMNQAYTPYGVPEIYICALNKFDEPPNSGGTPEEKRRDPWRGLWTRIAFLGHEGGHGLCGAPHTPKDIPGIMCGWPDNDPNLCYATLTGFTSGDQMIMCVPLVTGGFCSHPVAQRP